MLDIQRISKTFNPGTVNEKQAITDLSLHLNNGRICHGDRFQRRGQVHPVQRHRRQLLCGRWRHHRWAVTI